MLTSIPWASPCSVVLGADTHRKQASPAGESGGEVGVEVMPGAGAPPPLLLGLEGAEELVDAVIRISRGRRIRCRRI